MYPLSLAKMTDNVTSPVDSSGTIRRQRAPTITIDTSAVGSNDDEPRSSPVESAVEQSEPRNDQLHPSHGSPVNLRSSSSFDEKSRPTSPHNVSSAQWDNQNLLAVPPARSRANSIDTDSGQSTSSLTFVNTSSAHTGDLHDDSTTKDPKQGHGGRDVMNAQDPLRADPGTEQDFVRDANPFAFAPGHLGKLLGPKSLAAFYALGGLAGIEKGLRSDRKTGLGSDERALEDNVSFTDVTGRPLPETGAAGASSHHSKSHEGSFQDRRRIFGDNTLPEKKSKSIFQLMWMAYNDKVLLLLTAAAIISLALGLYQTFGQKHAPGQPKVEWVEGVAIIIAILIVVFVGSVNDWQKERQFVKLNRKKEDRRIKLIRSGKTQEISVTEVYAGDVVLLESGDMVPVDGIFIDGHGVKCDESSATGESDLLKKTPADHVWHAIESDESLSKLDCFILSGSKVTEGVGSFMVTATGVNSTHGKTMLSLAEDTEPTPLQSKLNVLAEYIAKLGGAAALLLFVVLLIKFLAELHNNNASPSGKAQQFLNILIQAVTIVVVAVPEGLPLAVTLALAFATKQMTKENNLVRVLRSCETMGNATTICSDKTGTLTQNVMTVVAGSIGTTSRFVTKTDETPDVSDKIMEEKKQPMSDCLVAECLAPVDQTVKLMWKDSIALNSTAFEAHEDGKLIFVGSKTETALLQFARDNLAMDAVQLERHNAKVVQLIPFDSGRKYMAVVLKIADQYRLYVKGASEIVLRQCTQIIADPTQGIQEAAMSAEKLKALHHMTETYASKSLRTIVFAYRSFSSWPPKQLRRLAEDKSHVEPQDLFTDLTFFAIVGIQDPLRPGVAKAVSDCLGAGVVPRMVTGDNILTARAIARECGILTANGTAMEGPEFRKLSRAKQREVLPALQVLARSSPEDKRVLVKRLKEMGQTVAVTGDGTNDAPALKAADVGFSMGVAGTEVAKEASDIILMDDNFASIVKALMWGRAVNDAVKKFLQFQITVNITAVALAFVSAVSSDEEQSVLTAVQLLWVNLIMDTFAALALATDPPTLSILDRKPDMKSAALITLRMWKMIIGQAIYQLVVTFILLYAGTAILNYDTDEEALQLSTLIFNTFVWMQIFNGLNCRRLDNRFNVFEGLQRNKFFIIIYMIMIGGQVMIIFVGGRAFNVTKLNGGQWGISIVLGALSIPIGVIIRLIPDELISNLVPGWLKRRSAPQVVVEDEEGHVAFNKGLHDIRKELSFIKKYKGGRLNHLRFKLDHPREVFVNRSRSEVTLPTTPTLGAEIKEHEKLPGSSPPMATPESKRRSRTRSRSNSALAGAAMAGIIAGSIGGWSPIERAEDDGARSLRGRSRGETHKDLGISTPIPENIYSPDGAAGNTLRVPGSSVNATNEPVKNAEGSSDIKE